MQIFQVERLPPRLYRFYIITNVNLKHTDYSNKPFIYKDHLSTEILEKTSVQTANWLSFIWTVRFLGSNIICILFFR